MNRIAVSLAALFIMGLLLLPCSAALAATDGFYQLAEVAAHWDGTDASRTKSPTSDYDYTYGDESSLIYNLPWSFHFYGQSFTQINVDTNGNIWFGAPGSTHSFILANTGRGGVISAWNQDLSSYYYGGVFVEHMTDPERVVIEWQTETYTDEGFYLPNNFEVVLFPNGTIRYDYKTFSAQDANDGGSGISRGNGVNFINLSETYGGANTLAGRSFLVTETSLPVAVIDPVASPTTLTTQSISGTLRGTGVDITIDTAAIVGEITYPTPTTWNCTLSGLVEGNNTVSVTATDGISQVTDSVTIVVDTIPPAVQIISPVGVVRNRPALSYTASDGIVTVKIDGDTVSKASGDYLDLLLDGPHIVRVEATDQAGNAAFVERSFTVATVFPISAALPKINAGSGHTAELKPDGTLWMWGRNWLGQLGDGTTERRRAPVQIGSDTDWASVSAGEDHTLALKNDGSLWAWGGNFNGELGDGTSVKKTDPVRIGTDSDWASVTAGYGFSFALKEDGSLWAWGANSYGQLGNGSTQEVFEPSRVGTQTDWAAIAVGVNHVLALKQDGTLWAWGANAYGQLGDGATSDIPTPIRVGTDADWASISAGSFHSLALKRDGTLWAWGANLSGQLGVGSYIHKRVPTRVGTDADWTNMAAGSGHSLALKADGRAWAWGAAGNGQLGTGSPYTALVPVQVAADKTWVGVSAGDYHSIALNSDGTIWSWGSNWQGELGDDTTIQRMLPALISKHGYGVYTKEGVAYTRFPYIILKIDADNAPSAMQFSNDNTNWSDPEPYATVKRWTFSDGYGMKTIYVRFQDSTGNWSDSYSYSITLSTTTPPVITLNSPVSGATNDGDPLLDFSVDGGDVVVKVDGTTVVKGPGDTLDPLSDGSHTITIEVTDEAGNRSIIESTLIVDTSPPQLAMPVVKVSAYYHTVALLADGSLWGWGGNWYGQVGDGTTNHRYSPVRVGSDSDWANVVAGVTHTVALKNDGSLLAWGDNSSGQLGDGTTINRITPVRIGSDSDWASVTAGWGFTLALKKNGTLWAWGDNGVGELGDGTTTSRTTPIQIGTDTDWTFVEAGDDHVVALKSNGTLWAWGMNSNGQVGDGTTEIKVIPTRIGTDSDWISTSAGWLHSVALKADGSLWAWGSNTYGQLGYENVFSSIPARVGTESDWVSAVAGDAHTIALKQDGSLWGWGANWYGQIGDGTMVDRAQPTRIGDGYSGATLADGGGDHTVVLKNGSLWAWGYNWDGNLGIGNTDDVTAPVQVPLVTGGSLLINGGAPTTLSRLVSLSYYAADITGVTEMQFSNNNITWSSPEPYTSAKSWLVAGDDGQNTVFARFKDAAGNWSQVYSSSIQYNSPPVVEISSPQLGFINSATPLLTYFSNKGVVEVKVDGIVVPKISGNFLDALTDGPHTVLVQSTDASGATGSKSVSFTVDTTPPAITVTPPQFNVGVLTGTVETGALVTVVANTPATVGTISYPTATTWSCPISNLALGDNTFTVTATDAAGNAGTASVVINARSLTATKRGNGTGTVFSFPGGITCGSACNTTFASATAVTLTAVPDPGSTFVGWSGGGCSGTQPCSISLTGDSTVFAIFAPTPAIPPPSSQWTTLGPEGVSASVVTIDPNDPQKIYVGTSNAGVFRSSDGGATWGDISSGLPPYSRVSALAATYDAAQQTTILYLGTVDGIYRSSDGGEHWVLKSANYLEADYEDTPAAIVVDPHSPQVVYAVRNYGQHMVYKSSNGGDAWSPLNVSTALSWDQASSLVVDPTNNPATLYLATNHSGIYRSSDGGSSWSRVNSGLPSGPYDFIGIVEKMVIDPISVPVTLYARIYNDGENTYKGTVTGDGSINWIAYTPATLPSDAIVMGLNTKRNPAALYASGNGLYRSTDHGSSWQVMHGPFTGSLPQPFNMAMDLDEGQNEVMYTPSQDGIYKSADSGENWSPAHSGINASSVSAFAIDPGNPAIFYAGLSSNKLLKSVDSGQTWTDIGPDQPWEYGPEDLLVDPTTTPSTVYVATYTGIYRSTDGGGTWQDFSNGLQEFNWTRGIDKITRDARTNTVYAGGLAGFYRLNRDGDGGGGWEMLRWRMNDFAVDPLSSNNLYVGDDGMYKSSDGGATWLRITDGWPAYYDHDDFGWRSQAFNLAIDPFNPGSVYAMSGERFFFNLDDDALSWTNVTDNMALGSETGALLFDPTISGAVYVATNQGMYKSRDSGLTWQPLGGAEKVQRTMVLTLDPIDPRIVYATSSVNGSGVLRFIQEQ